MPRPKPPAAPTVAADSLDRDLSDKLTDLTAAVERLADQVGLLRQVLDEFRDDFGWALNNDRLRSTPGHPTAVDAPPVPSAPDPDDPLDLSSPTDEPVEEPATPHGDGLPQQQELWAE
jgi:hypothetical protein